MSAAVYARIDVGDIRTGDMIRKEYDTDTHPVRAVEYTAPFEKDNWDGLSGRYYLIKRASVKLPTEPGLYLDHYGDIWRIYNERLFCLWADALPKPINADPARFAPFRRLVAEEIIWTEKEATSNG